MKDLTKILSANLVTEHYSLLQQLYMFYSYFFLKAQQTEHESDLPSYQLKAANINLYLAYQQDHSWGDAGH
jgi:hypothetical protein